MKRSVTTATEVGKFLENQARKGEPVTYGQVLDEFPDLPEMNGAWLSHPLCDMFGQLDALDHANGRPFRTALVYARDLSVPGQGFFDTLSTYRKKKISKNQQLEVWVRKASTSSKQSIAHAARVMAPTLFALAFASAAHAQGTMDFSGATTLMGTFKTFAIYAGAITSRHPCRPPSIDAHSPTRRREDRDSLRR